METRTLKTCVLVPSNANSKCGGGMSVTRVSYFCGKSYLGLEMVLVLASCSLKKDEKKRGISMVMTLSSSSTKHHGKYSQCPTFDIKQSLAGMSPEDRQSKSHGAINI